ncbi:hypothetical protein GE118_03665 [Mycoplasma sp. NEAQ87857]|uniref:hypothetical protein n=1 Tax=Mycoplasma sp. NEAQ87857 TaxID=2683967 RepID=UPI0013171AC0|nr:hypothetical protein [Mycoplasma sp. NEAQ87857]QGZ97880.1 hypothetical protein GE118_03665 [Mycoplasma sp. NEAQ87857]
MLFQKKKVNNLIHLLIDTQGYNYKQRKITYKYFAKVLAVNEIFKQQSLIIKINIDNSPRASYNDIGAFISFFESLIEFNNNINETEQEMIKNFYRYALMHLAYKAYEKQQDLPFLLTQAYNKDNEIELNNQKRQYYYQFLDQFQKRTMYNQTVIKLLRSL